MTVRLSRLCVARWCQRIPVLKTVMKVSVKGEKCSTAGHWSGHLFRFYKPLTLTAFLSSFLCSFLPSHYLSTLPFLFFSFKVSAPFSRWPKTFLIMILSHRTNLLPGAAGVHWTCKVYSCYLWLVAKTKIELLQKAGVNAFCLKYSGCVFFFFPFAFYLFKSLNLMTNGGRNLQRILNEVFIEKYPGKC